MVSVSSDSVSPLFPYCVSSLKLLLVATRLLALFLWHLTHHSLHRPSHLQFLPCFLINNHVKRSMFFYWHGSTGIQIGQAASWAQKCRFFFSSRSLDDSGFLSSFFFYYYFFFLNLQECSIWDFSINAIAISMQVKMLDKDISYLHRVDWKD